MKLSELASTLAPIERLSAEALHGILRGPGIQSLLAAQAGRGRTTPSDFAPIELARARILLAARDCGLSGSELATVNATLNGPVHSGLTSPGSALVTGGGATYGTALQSLVRGACAGEVWSLRIRFTIDADGNRQVRPWVRWEGWQESGRGAKAADLLNAETTRGTLEIPASELLKPLQAQLSEA